MQNKDLIGQIDALAKSALVRINDTAEDFEIRLPALCDDSLFSIAPMYLPEVLCDVQVVVMHFQQGPHFVDVYQTCLQHCVGKPFRLLPAVWP